MNHHRHPFISHSKRRRMRQSRDEGERIRRRKCSSDVTGSRTTTPPMPCRRRRRQFFFHSSYFVLLCGALVAIVVGSTSSSSTTLTPRKTTTTIQPGGEGSTSFYAPSSKRLVMITDRIRGGGFSLNNNHNREQPPKRKSTDDDHDDKASSQGKEEEKESSPPLVEEETEDDRTTSSSSKSSSSSSLFGRHNHHKETSKSTQQQQRIVGGASTAVKSRRPEKKTDENDDTNKEEAQTSTLAELDSDAATTTTTTTTTTPEPPVSDDDSASATLNSTTDSTDAVNVKDDDSSGSSVVSSDKKSSIVSQLMTDYWKNRFLRSNAYVTKLWTWGSPAQEFVVQREEEEEKALDIIKEEESSSSKQSQNAENVVVGDLLEEEDHSQEELSEEYDESGLPVDQGDDESSKYGDNPETAGASRIVEETDDDEASASSSSEMVVKEEIVAPEEIQPVGDDKESSDDVRAASNETLALQEEESKIIQINVTESSTTSNSTEKESSPLEVALVEKASESPYISSGLWGPIDNIVTFGLAASYPNMRVSSKLRAARKATARMTGMHGFISGKPLPPPPRPKMAAPTPEEEQAMNDIRERIAAIDRARAGVERAMEIDRQRRPQRRGLFGRRKDRDDDDDVALDPQVEIDLNGTLSLYTLDMNAPDEELRRLREARQEEERQLKVLEQRRVEVFRRRERLREERMEEAKRMQRVKEIDRLMSENQAMLLELACEKDVLQRRPNPLYSYTTESGKAQNLTVVEDGKVVEELPAELDMKSKREFNFPPDELVEEYLDVVFSSRRMTKMNHTFLWTDTELADDDDEELIGDDLLTPSAAAHKLYRDKGTKKKSKRPRNGGGGSWFLRQSLGGGQSLGAKIGEAAETAAYKAVCSGVMGALARAISSLHGAPVMGYSDIRLYQEQAPDLPPLARSEYDGVSDNAYAEEAIRSVINKKKSKKHKHKSKHRPSQDDFIQRDAVTEMLLSHVQISAPLLKLFPLAWQRAFLGNIITLTTAVISDFVQGLEFQLLGHTLSLSFKPITEADMLSQFGLAGGGFNNRRAKPEEFEAAVRATALDLSEELQFLDRWHERALGSGVLRDQVANLIARIVLTLTDEVLSGARMDLWAAQAGGPRMLAGLEYRTKPSENRYAPQYTI